MNRILCLVAIAASIAVVNVPAAQKSKKSDFVRNSELQRSGGERIMIPRYGAFTLVSARVARDSSKDCLVHIPTVREQLQRIAAGGGAEQASVWFEIKATTCDGEVCCMGVGTGCQVEIKAPGE